MDEKYRKYAGTVAAIVVGLAVDATAGIVGAEWWYFVLITLAAAGIAVLLWPREEPTPAQTRSLVKGNVGANSAIRRARTRGAHHLIEGDMGDGGNIEDIDFR
jgi:cobalamin synthase